MKYINVLMVLVALGFSCTISNDKADLIIKNAIIWTANPEQPQAGTMAIRDGRILAIGDDVDKYLGPDTEVIDTEAKLALGSDWFVAPPIPLLGIYAAVKRRTLDDKNPDGWVPEQKITIEQALMAYTIAGAYASFDEDLKGLLETGKLADFVIMDQNLLEIDPVAIKDVKVLMTLVGGKKVYELE